MDTHLTSDGRPFLWPRAPRWPYDAAYLAQLCQSVGPPALIMSMAGHQRKIDEAHRNRHGLAGICDHCRKTGVSSECGICGEIFCSHDCLRAAWDDHKSICATVYANASLAATLTQIEFKQSLSLDELRQAAGLKLHHARAEAVERSLVDEAILRIGQRERLREDTHTATIDAASPPVPPPIRDGDVVIVVGLQSAAGRPFNGTSAVITSACAEGDGRFAVNVGALGMKRLRTSNVRLPTEVERAAFVNPKELSNWNPTRCIASEFLNAMSGMEKVRSTLGVEQGAEFGNRESWVIIANYIDSANGVAPDERLCRINEPPTYVRGAAVRIMYQCVDESRGVIVDVIGVKVRVAPTDGIEEPVIICSYCEIEAAQMAEPGFVRRVITGTNRGEAATMRVENGEHAVLMRMLRKNEHMLDPSFRSREAKRRSASDGWRTAFVSPTSVESRPKRSKSADERSKEFQCDGPDCANPHKTICRRCQRCQQTRYCSVACQKAHWKGGGHRAVCRASSRPFVEYDVTFVEPAQRGLFHARASANESVRARLSRGAPKAITSEDIGRIGAEALARRAVLGGEFTVKVQCARGGGLSTPMMTYDRKRELNVMLAHGGALPASTSERHRSDVTLRNLIQRKGEVGGQKAYCTACVGGKANYIRIYVDELDAPKEW